MSYIYSYKVPLQLLEEAFVLLKKEMDNWMVIGFLVLCG